MIRQLQEEIVSKDNQLKKAAEDMKFFKLELVNRDKSFNQMFGTSANVGVIDPTAGKARGSGKQQTVVASNIKGGQSNMNIGAMNLAGGAPPTAATNA